MNQELNDLNNLLGEELLCSLLNTKAKKLEYYIENQHQIPSVVEDKLRNVSAIVRNLQGCYPPNRIRKFFENKNSKLGFKKPREIMSGDWWPRDHEVLSVLMLSADMKG